MAILQLLFEGMCGVFCWQDGRKRIGADIILVNAQFNAALGLPEHLAVLQVHHGIFEASDVPLRSSAAEWRIAGHAIRIGDGQPPAESAGLDLVTTDQSRPWQGLKWTLDIASFAPGNTPRKDLAVGGEGRVAAAMRLVDGTLEAAPPSVGHSTIWAVRHEPTALTDRMLYSRECPDAVELQFAELEPDGRLVGTIRVKPVEDRIVLRIRNLPMSQPAQAMHRHAPAKAHIRAAYELFDRVPPSAAEPRFLGSIVSLDPWGPRSTGDDPLNCYHFHWPPPPDPAPDVSPFASFAH
ncbi:MAG TPA: hypothetical protein VKE96_33625 [Vicinamibacterales bacterium]|nr:hypothetical protein [Vicinamibacterales bacterium]